MGVLLYKYCTSFCCQLETIGSEFFMEGMAVNGCTRGETPRQYEDVAWHRIFAKYL